MGASAEASGAEKSGVKKFLKRKRASIGDSVVNRDKGVLMLECRRELDGLYEYYKEVSGYKLQLEESFGASSNSVIACLLEESNLPFSKLVDEIYGVLKSTDGVTLSSVRSNVLAIGQRMMYGVGNPDADVLEDESESCLWCWEVEFFPLGGLSLGASSVISWSFPHLHNVFLHGFLMPLNDQTREMKLLPVKQCGILNIRRIARKRIHERISVLSDMLSALSLQESHGSCNRGLTEASAKLGKVLNAEGICSLIQKLKQKNDADITEKGAKSKEREIIQEIERTKRNTEKEKKRADRELQKEKCQSENVEKEERICEKEDTKLKKLVKKQQDESEKDQRHPEKEETELREQLALQKQAAVMKRFLNIKKIDNSPGTVVQGSFSKGRISDSSCKTKDIVDDTVLLMDSAFAHQDRSTLEDLRRLHVDIWHKLSCYNKSSHWGVRRNPKLELIKELKLQRSSSEAEHGEEVTTPDKRPARSQVNRNKGPSPEKPVDEIGECSMSSSDNLHAAFISVRSLNKKLLQFDKSHRPAYYGSWKGKSAVVGPRCPFKKDTNLDYDADSDEDWEEKDPGESLSDCDKDELVEEEDLIMDDEDENEDSFIVSDGHLSEDEGVKVDGSSGGIEDEAGSSLCPKPEVESEDFNAVVQQHKCLHNLTEQALRKGRPLVILNLMHEKTERVMAEDLSGATKFDRACLQALCMQAFPGSSAIDLSTNDDQSHKDQEVCRSNSKNSTPVATGTVAIPDSDLPDFVSAIRSNPHGMGKIVEMLQLKFPSFTKSQLRNKVREISDFVDNRWQVKKEVLYSLGLSSTPDKVWRQKGISTYFSKGCLQLEAESVATPKISPEASSKTEVNSDADHAMQTDT